MARMLLISSDCHAAPPTEDYHQYLEAKYHPALDDYLEAREKRLAAQVQRQDAHISALNEDFERRRRFATQLDIRVEALEGDGVVCEVLFPDGEFRNEIPFAGRFGALGDDPVELHQAALRAYNRWLAETHVPQRQVALGVVPTYDSDYALAQVKTFRAQGLDGVMPQWDGLAEDQLPLFDDALDPVWEACAADDLTINFHSGSGVPPRVSRRQTDMKLEMQRSCENPFWSRRSLWQMILGGVFVRHPTLRAAFTEVWADWIPRTLACMDWTWEQHGGDRAKEFCPEPPSVYFHRNCCVGATTASVTENQMRYEIGVENFMYGTDFPHSISPWHTSNEFLRETMGAAGVSEDEARAMLGLNAVRHYGLDLGTLRPIADRVGPEPTDVLRAPVGTEDLEKLSPYVQSIAHRPLSMI